MSLQTNAYFDDNQATGSDPSETVDFAHTLEIDSISLVDASGNPMPGVDLIGDNGESVLGINTPEPASFAFVGVGLMALGATFLRRKQLRSSSSTGLS